MITIYKSYTFNVTENLPTDFNNIPSKSISGDLCLCATFFSVLFQFSLRMDPLAAPSMTETLKKPSAVPDDDFSMDLQNFREIITWNRHVNILQVNYK